jgi:hypothetical protein
VSITDSDLPTRLRALPAELPRRELSPAFPDAVRAGARRRRNRARVAGAAALVVLVAAAVGIPVGLLTGSGTARSESVIPARPPGPSSGRFMVYGTKVGWLPHGYVVVDDEFQDVIRPGVAATPYAVGRPPDLHYTEQWVSFADPADVAAVRAADKPRLDGSQYKIIVRRGQVPTAAEEKAVRARAEIYETSEDVTVAGHPATLTHFGVQVPPAWAWSLSWMRGADASVSVSGSDEDVVGRIAENVTLGPAPSGPADPATAAAQIQDAARRAFQGSAGLGMLDAVDDPDGLAYRTVDQGLSRDPRTGATARLGSVGDIVFLGPTEAATQLKILYPDEPALGGPVDVNVRITLTAGGWKLTRQSFCLGMSNVFSGCPTIP